MNETTNLFETAARKKFRFNSVQGMLTVELLWDLPLTSKTRACLDDVAKDVNGELKLETEESFVETKTSARKVELQMKLDLVKHIIATKQQENAEALKKEERKEQREKLARLIADKKDETLKGMSEEQLVAELAKLSD